MKPARNPSLFDIEDVAPDQVAKVRDLRVDRVSTKDVDEFAQRYHYSENGGSRLWRYGLWDGLTLYGVVSYNLPTRTCCESVFGKDHGPDRIAHMGRLVCADHAPPNSESRLIAGSLPLLRIDYPTVWGVLTYADTSVGHYGTIYQATNALYTGEGGDVNYFIDAKGQRRSAYLSGYVTKERGESMGWVHHTGGMKHRYVYLLGSKTHRRFLHDNLRFPHTKTPYCRNRGCGTLEYPKKDGQT